MSLESACARGRNRKARTERATRARSRRARRRRGRHRRIARARARADAIAHGDRSFSIAARRWIGARAPRIFDSRSSESSRDSDRSFAHHRRVVSRGARSTKRASKNFRFERRSRASPRTLRARSKSDHGGARAHRARSRNRRSSRRRNAEVARAATRHALRSRPFAHRSAHRAFARRWIVGGIRARIFRAAGIALRRRARATNVGLVASRRRVGRSARRA